MEKANTRRRNFMMALGLGSLGAAATLLGGRHPQTPDATSPQATAPQPSKGYHVSEHVETYYRKARI